jgi:hypothetical protein
MVLSGVPIRPPFGSAFPQTHPPEPMTITSQSKPPLT